jgi:hypothetical protein
MCLTDSRNLFRYESKLRPTRRLSMSGSGGGRSGDNPVQPNCRNLSGPTQLSSPQQDVVEDLEEGVQLTLSVEDSTVVAHFGDRLAGTITWTQLAALVECIERGYEYVAIVTDIDGGRVRVRVELAG